MLLLLLFIPVVFQYIIGNKILNPSIINNRWIQDFIGVCIISLILQFGITIVSFVLTVRSMASHGNRCATGAVGIFFFSFVITVFMLLVMLLQFSRRKRYNKANNE